MATTTKKTRWKTLPCLLDDPEMRALRQRMNDIKAEIGKLQAELDRRGEQYRRWQQGDRKFDAEAILQGADPLDMGFGPEWIAENGRLYQRLQGLKAALELASRKQQSVRHEASARLLAPLLPAYREYLQQAADLAAKLVELTEAERELVEHLNREGLSAEPLRLIPLAPHAHHLAGWLEVIKRYHGITPRT